MNRRRTGPNHLERDSYELTASTAGREDMGVQVAHVGLGRVIGIVLIMHIIAVGGILAFRSLEESETSKATETSSAEPVRDAVTETKNIVPAPAISEEAIIVEHPTKKGFKRYRVSGNEELATIARQFNASAAEIEKENNLKPGEELYVGQWLSVPDNRKGIHVEKPRSDATLADVKLRQEATTEDTTSGNEGSFTTQDGVTLGPRVDPPSSKRERPERNETYVVKKGDTAYGIAKQYGLKWQELLEANGMTDPLELQAGQEIRIP